jgi:hypothetical protein
MTQGAYLVFLTAVNVVWYSLFALKSGLLAIVHAQLSAVPFFHADAPGLNLPKEVNIRGGES